MKEKLLEIKNVYKTFKISKKQQKILNIPTAKVVAVNDVSVDIYKGEVFCLLGTNGAGKTTMLRMIASLIKPDQGKINIKENIEKDVKNIGFLTTELKLDGFFTPNYLFDFFGKLYHIDSNELLQRRKILFELLEIDKFAEVKLKNLSTGMKQKVSIAVSLVHNPDIIILDEPTNGLDIVTTREVIKFIKMLKEEGKSIILSTHIFDVVDKLADRVGVMVEGKMICCEAYEEFIRGMNTEEKFFKLYYGVKGVKENELE
ncbi:sodium transport system ATP-binding protein [Lachnotalea glycerini]|uniref:Sodium transport system ATP-binding protein n=1 Tax=Lachnotalea glycerini TaxID=1763509 RepID=A0A318EU23_9FIRM|nr:ABC transporter ATP-binding protein [Lachnotalea glycerini]PXV91871.1 sodium transport system ATP-binding protein [Lachnotalea glycerini]